MIINEFLILDYVEKTSLKLRFSNRQNLIVGKKNKIGKSSIVKSLYFTLGYENKNFMPDGWNYCNMKYKIKYTHNQNSGYIIRQQDLFYVKDHEGALNEKEYRKWFQQMLGVDYQLKPSKSDRESDVYASAIIMPFYIDQDISWTDSPYKSHVMAMYGRTSYRSMFEKLFSVSNDSILKLKEKLKELNTANKKLSDKISILEELINERDSNKVSSIPLKENYFEKQEEYLEILKRVSRVMQKCESEKLSSLDKINKTFAKRNHHNEILKQLKKKNHQLEGVCQYCGSQSSITNLSNRLVLMNSLDDIKYQVDILGKDLDNEQSKLNNIVEREKAVKQEYQRYMNILNENPDLNSINQYIEDSAENLASEALINKNEIAINTRSKNITEIDKINVEIGKLDKTRKEHLADIEKKYQEIFLDILSTELTSISGYSPKDYSFLNFTKISGSGTDSNLKKYLIYLVYFNLLDTYAEIKVPFLIDSFIRSEIDGDNQVEMFSAITKYFLNLKAQTFFTVLHENLKYIKSSEQFNKIYIDEKPILKKDYFEEHARDFD